MLKHHEFYQAQATACAKAWAQLNVPTDLLPVLPEIQCEACGSSLLKPSGDEEESSDLESGEVTYICVGCANRAPFVPLLEETLIDFVGGYDPYSGEEPPTAECPECQHETFVHAKGECLWCGMQLAPEGCARCGNTLTLDDYDNSLCGYCQYQADKYRDA